MPSTLSWKHIKKSECPHISELKEDTTSEKDACSVCGHKDDLRICLTRLPDGQACGDVYCCESYKAHNTEHFEKTKHPFIKPQKCDYDWLWCYPCNAFLE